MSKSQNEKLLAALACKPMTAGEIWSELGIARASARVFDLRNDGYDVRSTEITVATRNGIARVALYSLASVQRTLRPVHPGRGCTSSSRAEAA